MPIIKKSEECSRKIKQIKQLFEQAETIFGTFTDIENQAMFNFHNENSSLNHCIRWSLQAATELDEADDLGGLG